MELDHSTINVLQHIIDESKEMDINDSPLANTDRTPNRLMDNGRIPMLG
jgi:hypothetical protein